MMTSKEISNLIYEEEEKKGDIALGRLKYESPDRVIYRRSPGVILNIGGSEDFEILLKAREKQKRYIQSPSIIDRFYSIVSSPIELIMQKKELRNKILNLVETNKNFLFIPTTNPVVYYKYYYKENIRRFLIHNNLTNYYTEEFRRFTAALLSSKVDEKMFLERLYAEWLLDDRENVYTKLLSAIWNVQQMLNTPVYTIPLPPILIDEEIELAPALYEELFTTAIDFVSNWDRYIILNLSIHHSSFNAHNFDSLMQIIDNLGNLIEKHSDSIRGLIISIETNNITKMLEDFIFDRRQSNATIVNMFDALYSLLDIAVNNKMLFAIDGVGIYGSLLMIGRKIPFTLLSLKRDPLGLLSAGIKGLKSRKKKKMVEHIEYFVYEDDGFELVPIRELIDYTTLPCECPVCKSTTITFIRNLYNRNKATTLRKIIKEHNLYGVAIVLDRIFRELYENGGLNEKIYLSRLLRWVKERLFL